MCVYYLLYNVQYRARGGREVSDGADAVQSTMDDANHRVCYRHNNARRSLSRRTYQVLKPQVQLPSQLL